MECHIHNCKTPATQRLWFVGGMRDYYCTKHAGIFPEDIIEDCELLPSLHDIPTQERYRAFLQDMVGNAEYAAYLEHNSSPKGEDY